MELISVANEDIGLSDDGFGIDRCQWDDNVARKFRNPMFTSKLAGLSKPSNNFVTSFAGERYIPNPF
ncbi:MAG: hypothetical protein ACR2PB_08140 [Desulfocapsaceae bacterium]